MAASAISLWEVAPWAHDAASATARHNRIFIVMPSLWFSGRCFPGAYADAVEHSRQCVVVLQSHDSGGDVGSNLTCQRDSSLPLTLCIQAQLDHRKLVTIRGAFKSGIPPLV